MECPTSNQSQLDIDPHCLFNSINIRHREFNIISHTHLLHINNLAGQEESDVIVFRKGNDNTIRVYILNSTIDLEVLISIRSSLQGSPPLKLRYSLSYNNSLTINAIYIEINIISNLDTSSLELLTSDIIHFRSMNTPNCLMEETLPVTTAPLSRLLNLSITLALMVSRYAL